VYNIVIKKTYYFFIQHLNINIQTYTVQPWNTAAYPWSYRVW